MPILLLVIPDASAAWVPASDETQEVLVATEPDAARQVMTARAIDVLIADHRLDGIALLNWSLEHQPHVRRLLLAEYEALPKLMLTKGRGAIERLVPQPPPKEKLALMLAHLVGGPDVPSRMMPQSEVPPSGYPLLVRSVRALVELRGLVIRHLPRDGKTTQLQLVLPAASAAVRERMAAEWGAPIKAKGQATTRKHRRHPVLQVLGGDLSEHQELFAQQLDDGTWAYLAFLPWARRPDVTVVIGFAGTLSQGAANEELASLHDLAIAETLEFPLPPPEVSQQTGGWFVQEYDWIVTKTYVGPDRRDRPTTFANRYMFIGQRRRRLKNVPSFVMPFVDQFNREAAFLALAYVLFSLFDTVATYRFVAHGNYAELNPLLRPLIVSSPWRFLIVKNVLSLSALFAMVRFHLVRAGRIVLWVNAVLYGALVVYWLTLF